MSQSMDAEVSDPDSGADATRLPSHGESLEQILASIAELYPDDLRAHARRDLPRMACNIGLVLERAGADVRICDIGGGMGYFSIGCAALGMDAVVIDDFGDATARPFVGSALELHHRYGVEVVYRDVIAEGLGVAADSFDVITTFDSMEHWHASPKRLFAEVRSALRQNGLFILGVPNSVNARKRLTVPFGKGKWSTMSDWYEQPVFRGHVREPDVADLLYIARDMGLSDVEIKGRNWLGTYGGRVTRALTKVADPFLQLRPSLCSDLYMIGRARS